MPYVIRKGGQVVGLLTHKPVDESEGDEFLPDDHQDVIFFREVLVPAPAEQPINAEELLAALEKKGLVTREEVLAEKDGPGAIPA